jgi:hypothetical protein
MAKFWMECMAQVCLADADEIVNLQALAVVQLGACTSAENPIEQCYFGSTNADRDLILIARFEVVLSNH